MDIMSSDWSNCHKEVNKLIKNGDQNKEKILCHISKRNLKKSIEEYKNKIPFYTWHITQHHDIKIHKKRIGGNGAWP